MIAYVKAHKVAYCIVHKVDRLARNRADDVEIHLALREAGVLLVSATENIDETLIGDAAARDHVLDRGVLLREPRQRGHERPRPESLHRRHPHARPDQEKSIATPSTATTSAVKCAASPKTPIGHDSSSGHSPRTRPGTTASAQLRTELTKKGLRSVPTPKRPARPLGLSSVHRMLQNPYYRGDVVYREVRYDGAHERLVEPEIWYQVQSVLRAHAQSGVRTQKHDHYLKGTLYCGRCRQRMTIIHAKNRHGNIYPYFICLGRNNKRTTCDMPYAPVNQVEKLVADYYRRITLTPAMTDALRGMLTHEFDQLTRRHEAIHPRPHRTA